MHGINPGAYAADLAALREDLGDDDEMVRDLCRMFGNDTPQLMQEIVRALDAGDLKTVQRTAHRLKGSIGVFHAPEVFAVAHRMETAGQHGDEPCAREVLPLLHNAIEAMLAQLGAHTDAACAA